MESDFDQFVAARTGPLLRLAYILTSDAHTAEDVVQEVLTRAHTRWDHIQSASSPNAYVRRMVVNETLSRRRRRRLELFRSPDQMPEPVLEATEHQAADRDLVWRTLAMLPARQRTVLVLRYYEDLPDADIAALMSIHPGTVRSLAFRGLTALRNQPGLLNYADPTPPDSLTSGNDRPAPRRPHE